MTSPSLVVSDTSPLSNLAMLGHLDSVARALHRLRGEARFFISRKLELDVLKEVGEVEV